MKLAIGILSLFLSINASAAPSNLNRKIIASCSAITHHKNVTVHLDLIDAFDQNLVAEIRTSAGETALVALKTDRPNILISTDPEILLTVYLRSEADDKTRIYWPSEALKRQFYSIAMTCAYP